MRLDRGLPLVRAFVALALAPSGAVHAANATWTASSNGAWDTSANWNTGAAASGSTSTATFGSATGNGISINTAVTIGTLQFNSGAPAYNIAVNSNSSLTLGANGIVNNSSNPLSLTVNASARVNFEGTSSAGNSILFLNSGGVLDFSRSTGTLTAGSIAGSTSTNIYLGSRTLTVGSLNSNTLFQGIISDGGNSGATGGSLTKVGTGTLTLDRDNTYTGNTTISAGTLQIGNGGSTGSVAGNIVNNASLVFHRGGTSTYAGKISGTGTVTKSSGGTLTLSGANTYSGGTLLNGGSLQVSADNNLGGAGALTFNGGTLLFGGTFNSSRNVTLTGAGTFNTSTFGPVFSGVVSGGGAFTKSGSGTLTFSGNNTYTGNTTVSAGTLRIGNGGTSGALAGNVSVSNGATLAFSRSDSQTYGGLISGSGSFSKLGANTLTLTGNNTYSGGTTVNGTLIITGSQTGGGTATVNSGATLRIGNGGTTGMIGGNIVDNGVLAFNRSDSFTFAGNISGTGSLVKYGAGTLTLTGTLSYAGTTSVLGGALLIGTGGNTGGIEGDLVIDSALTFNRADDYLYSGVISGTGSLTKLGAGTLTFTGANLYTGGTTITGGALQLGNGGTTGSIVGNVVNNSRLVFNRSDSQSFSGVISGTGSVTKLGANTLTLSGANTYSGGTTVSAGTLKGTTQSLQGPIVNNGTVYFDQSAAGTYAGSMSGSGALSKQGSKLTLTGANTYTGASSFVGDVELSGVGASINGTSGITLAPTASFAQASLRVADASLVTPGALVVGEVGTGWFYVSGAGSASTASAVLGANAGSNGNALITSSAPTAWANTGTLVVGGSGTGTLTVENGATLQAGSIVLSQLAGSSGTLNIGLGASAATINTASVTGGVGNTGLVSFHTNDPAYTFAAVLAGNLRVEKLGSGTVTLTGVNTYTGGTKVMAGTLRGTTQSLQGPIVNNGAVYFDQNTAGTYAGSMSGSGALSKQGSKLTLTGANTYTGASSFVGDVELSGVGASINGTSGITLAPTASFAQASLRVADASLVTPGALVVGETGTGWFYVSGAGSASTASAVLGANAGSNGNALITSSAPTAWTNTGTLVVGGSGTGTLTVENGATLQAGGIVLSQSAGSSGTLNIGLGASAAILNTASVTGGVGNTGLVSFHTNDPAYTFAAVLAGNLRVEKLGSGTTILTGANTYTGGTTINGGKLQIGNGGTSGSIVGDILNNGTLIFNRSDDFTFAGAIAGTGSLIKDGAGTLTLTGSVTYTGTTTVLGGALLIGTGGTSGNWDGDLNINSTLTFNRSDNVVYSHVVSGSGSLIKMGTGTLTLTNANTYTGGTVIDVGRLQIGNGGTTGSIVGDVTNNADLAFNRADNVTFSGAITGIGTLTKLGAGTLTLTGNNTYTGATSLVGNVNVMSGGRIEGTDSIAVAAGAAQTGALRVSGTGSRVTTAGTITVGGLGSGALTVDDGAIVNASSILLGAEAGSTGVLNLGAGGAAGLLNATTVVDGLGAGSAVNLNFTDPSYTLSTNLLHTLTVNQNGPGTTILTGVNSYTGGTHLNAGTLRVRSNSNLGGAASALYFNGGTLQWEATVTNLPRAIILEAGGGTIDTDTFNVTSTGVISGSGNLTKTGAGILALTGTNTYTGDLTVSAGTLRGSTTSLRGNILNNGAIEFLQTANGTFAGVVSGSGSLTKQNAGNLTLGGANTYTGATTVSAGALTVSGSLASPVSVGVSGRLAGTGTINGNIAVSGVLAPGNATTAPFGTLAVNGTVSFAPGSTLRVQTNEFGDNSKLNVVGATHGVTISGGTVEVLTGGGEYNPHTEYTLISSAGGVTGAFDQVTTDFAFLAPTLSYDTGHVSLTLDRNDLTFGSFAQTASVSSSAVEAAEYLDAVSGEGTEPLVSSITQMNAAQASEAFEEISGSSLTSMTRVSMKNTARLFDTLASRLGTRDADASSGLWAQQFATRNTEGLRTAGLHTAIGLDAALTSQTIVGVSAIYTRDDVMLDDRRLPRSHVRTPQLAAYVNHSLHSAQLRGIVGCGTHRYNTERVVATGADTSRLSAQREGQECSAYVQAEMGSGAASLRPIVGLMYSRLHEPAYVERGGPAALAVDRHSTESVLSHAGLRYAWSSSDERVSFQGSAIWTHELAANDAAFRASLAAAAADARRFRVRSADRGRDSLVIGTGFATELRAGFSFYGDYSLQLDSGQRPDHAFIASFGYAY